MNNNKRIVTVLTMMGTVLYEIFLFGYLIEGIPHGEAFTWFFTYLFSLAGAIPILFILIFAVEGQVKRYEYEYARQTN
jgi:hypothetical protein